MGDQPDPRALLEQAYDERNRIAASMQTKSFRFGVLAAALAPTAVLFLAAQALVFAAGETPAIPLIAAELVVVGFALAASFLDLGYSHHGWIAHRVRAELLRREQFLFSARVGPYLNTSPASACNDVQQRLLTLNGDLEGDLLPLTVLHDQTQGAWRDALEDAHRASSSMTAPDLKQQVTDYLERRVKDQRTWFSKRAGEHDLRDRKIEYAAKIALVLALIIAALHLGALLGQRDPKGDHLMEWLVVAALVLPPLGAAFLSIRALLEGKRLSRSYHYHARALAELEGRLMALISECQTQLPPDAGLRFKRLALQTEELLSAELRQWWVVMHPATPSPGA